MYYYENYIEENDLCEYGILSKKQDNYFVNDILVENNRGIVNDIVYILENKVVNIKERSNQQIAGILYMNSNKSYGRNKKGMNYYKFKALNNKFGVFLVPSKLNIKRKVYITITFNKWDINDKYPIGICTNIIGELGVRDNEYNILLYKHDLKMSKIKINKVQSQLDLDEKIDDIDYDIITIDPDKCKDIDDGISINICNNITEIGVHITDVSYYMENYLDNLKSGLCSSIYYDNKQINMIPELYSTNICSLLEGNKRKCLSIIYKYDNTNLIDYKIKLCNVFVKKNYSYDNAEMLINNNDNKHTILMNLWNFMRKMNSNINDTHKLIEILMINSNKLVGELLYNYDKSRCVLRVHNKKTDYVLNDDLNKDINDYLKIKTFESAIYCIGSENPYHYGLNSSYYTHYTSPIRRVVDILNHINLKKYLNNEKLLKIDDNLIEKINKQNKLIKKFSFDCKILDVFYNINDKEYSCEGIIIDVTEKKMIIYINELNMEYKYKINDLNRNYKKYDIINLRLYFIREGERLEDKILVKLLD